MKKFLLIFSLSLSITGIYAITGTGNITSGAVNRTFTYHAPGSAVDPNLPVMIVMHGDGGTGASVQAQTGFDAVADANNFLVIYPDAVAGAWNRYADAVPGDAGLGNPGAPDDVLFISDLIDYLCSAYYINPNKVYASGHSAGGFMAYNLAIQLNSKIAAFAPASASLWADPTFETTYFTLPTAVPILHIHGDADVDATGVDYIDMNQTPDYEYPLAQWSSSNCGTTTYTASNVIVAGYAVSHVYCDGLTTPFKKIELVQIIGMGHAWPNPAIFDASTYIWNFCNQYSLSTGVSCAVGIEEEKLLENISVYPVPATSQLNISGNLPLHSTIEIMDGLGKVVYTQKDFNQTTIPVVGLSSGIYFLTIRAGNASKKIKFIKN